MNLLDSFQRYIDENDLATHDDRILLTVSGGVDSMVMLSLFTRCGYRVGVAHCNFQLRGAESDEDEVLVEDEAKKHGAAFYNKRFETRAEMERTGESMEMAARRLRTCGRRSGFLRAGASVTTGTSHAGSSDRPWPGAPCSKIVFIGRSPPAKARSHGRAFSYLSAPSRTREFRPPPAGRPESRAPPALPASARGTGRQ